MSTLFVPLVLLTPMELPTSDLCGANRLPTACAAANTPRGCFTQKLFLTSWRLFGADLLQVLVWLTPAGTVDDGGKEQPAYLNFDVVLLGPPAGNDMQGIVGETYTRMLAGDAVNDPNSHLFIPDNYEFHGKVCPAPCPCMQSIRACPRLH